jgi:hypothetical protein
MTLVKARVSLFSLFVASLLLQVVAIEAAFQKGHIYSAERSNLIFILVQVYSVHLAIIIGGIFSASLARTSNATKRTPGYLFCIAVVLVFIWNSFLVGPSLTFGFMGKGTDTDLADYLRQVATYSSWLVTPRTMRVGGNQFIVGLVSEQIFAGNESPSGSRPKESLRLAVVIHASLIREAIDLLPTLDEK